jgi:hypothetical protein
MSLLGELSSLGPPGKNVFGKLLCGKGSGIESFHMARSRWRPDMEKEGFKSFLFGLKLKMMCSESQGQGRTSNSWSHRPRALLTLSSLGRSVQGGLLAM